VLTSGDNGSMDSAGRPLGPVALGAVLGLLSVTELAIRLIAKSTVHAGLAAGPPVHTGINLPTALLMGAFCLLATVPAGWLRPLPAALAVCLAALVSLVLFELVTIAGAAALLVIAYRLARSGLVVLAVALAAPFLGLALVLAGPAPRPDAVPAATNASGLWAAGADTRVLAVLLAAAIPVAAVAALARGAREQTETHSATRELTEGMLADHLARGERARIARELHDVVAHHISMIAVQAETGRLTTPGLPDAGAQRFAAIGDTARAGLTEMRRLLGVLREDAEQDKEPQPNLEPAGPARTGADRRPQPGLPQLGDLVDGAREASGSVVRLIMSGQAARLDPGVELAAYRIVQEALTNARRHAPGAAVDVELRYADDALRLRIRDNGPGQAGRYHAGHGLLGMRERAAAVGGSLQTGDAGGGGFLVEAELPAKAPDAVTGTPPERITQ
jgi:signal transduction histidine kinase